MGKRIKVTVKIAKFYPQTAYCAFTSGFREKFEYFIRIIPNISNLLQPFENIIGQKFVTSLFKGITWNDKECKLLSLPVKLGGIGITNITSISYTECQTSKIITKNFMNEIKNKKCESNADLENSSNQ